MARLQVIQRDADPTIKQANALSDVLQKNADRAQQAEAIRIQAEQLKINARNAQIETDKLKQKSVADVMTQMADIVEKTQPGPLRDMAVEGLMKANGALAFEGMAEVGSALKKLETLTAKKTQAETGKLEADTAESQSKAAMMDRFTAGGIGGGGIPPGTTMGPSGLTIPLNPQLSDAESTALSVGEQASGMIANLKGIFSGNKAPGFVGKLRAEQTTPYATAGNKGLSDIQSYLTYLKASVPFMRGGKALTKTESERIDTLFQLSGKSNERILKDLSTFEQEFLSKSGLVTGGTAAVGRSEIMPKQPNQAPQQRFQIEEVAE